MAHRETSVTVRSYADTLPCGLDIKGADGYYTDFISTRGYMTATVTVRTDAELEVAVYLEQHNGAHWYLPPTAGISSYAPTRVLKFEPGDTTFEIPLVREYFNTKLSNKGTAEANFDFNVRFHETPYPAGTFTGPSKAGGWW